MNNVLGQQTVFFHTPTTVDVFFGRDGWEPHARFSKKRTKQGIFVQKIAGEQVPSFVFKQLLQEVNK